MNGLENNSIQVNGDIDYFAWVIAYEMNLQELATKYNISECDMLYDFCNYVATNYVEDSKEYRNPKYSSYEMFYKFLYNSNGLEDMFKKYFDIKGFGLKKEELREICNLYNIVGDLYMLEYIRDLNIKDTKLQYMLRNMFELNEKMLDSNIYLDYRREFLDYLGFDWDEDGNLIFEESGFND